jgi:hypothetical protein
MKYIFIGFLLNVTLAGVVYASADNEAKASQSKASLLEEATREHIDYLKQENLTPQMMVERTEVLINRAFDAEQGIFRKHLEASDVASPYVPLALIDQTCLLSLYNKSTGQASSITLNDWNGYSSGELFRTCQGLLFQGADYLQLLSSATSRAVMAEFMLKHYKNFQLDTTRLGKLGKLEQTTRELKVHAENATLSLTGFLMGPYIAAHSQRVNTFTAGVFGNIEISAELGATDLNLRVQTAGYDWAELVRCYVYSRQLLVDQLARDFVPSMDKDHTYAKAFLQSIYDQRLVGQSQEQTLTELEDLFQRVTKIAFQDPQAKPHNLDSVVGNFCQLVELFHMYREANFARYARLHGMNISEAPDQFFNRRMVISLIESGVDRPKMLQIQESEPEQVKQDLVKAGLTNPVLYEFMKIILFHMSYEVLLRQGYTYHVDTQLKALQAEKIQHLFSCHKDLSRHAFVLMVTELLPVMNSVYPWWGQTDELYQKSKGKLTALEIRYDASFEKQELIEQTFDQGWGRLALAYSIDRVALISSGLTQNKLSQRLLQKLSANIAMQQEGSKTNQLVAEPAAQPAPSVSTALSAKKKKKKKKTGKRVAVVQPAEVQTPVLKLEPQVVEVATSFPAPEPTVEELQGQVATLKEAELKLREELEAARAWGTALQDELNDVRKSTAQELKQGQAKAKALEGELEAMAKHKDGAVAKLNKVRETAKSDLTAKDQLLESAHKARKGAEQQLVELRGQLRASNETQRKLDEELNTTLKQKQVLEDAMAKLEQAAKQTQTEAANQVKLFKREAIRIQEEAVKHSQQLNDALEQSTHAEQQAKAENLKLAARLAAVESELCELKALPVAQVQLIEAPSEELVSLRQEVEQLRQANLVYEDTFARGNQQYLQAMADKQLHLDTLYAEFVRLQVEHAKVNPAIGEVQPTSEREIQLAMNAATWRKAYETLKEQDDNNRLLIRQLKKQAGQETNDISHSE